MPYASDAQRKKFHAMEAEGKIAHSVVHEFDEASKGLNLPKKKKRRGMMGSEVEHSEGMKR